MNYCETLPDFILTDSASFKNKKKMLPYDLILLKSSIYDVIISSNWRKKIFSYKKVCQMSLGTMVREYPRLSKNYK